MAARDCDDWREEPTRWTANSLYAKEKGSVSSPNFSSFNAFNRSI